MNKHQPRIFYFCYRSNDPAGGQKHTYRHVDILNDNGVEAFVFHPGELFRLSWFENMTKVISSADFEEFFDPRCDFIVLPENLGEEINRYPGRKVIFNKNLFYGFSCFGQSIPEQYPYLNPEVVAAFAVSEHNSRSLQFAYPNLLVERVYLEVDPAIFKPRPIPEKKRLIACIPKELHSLLTVRHTLASRAEAGLNKASSFDWVFLGDKSEKETSDILQDALIFIFLSSAEGMGRMPLEAMACGCFVICYDVGPLKEIVPASGRFPHNELLGIVQAIENILNAYPNISSDWIEVQQKGYLVAQEYSMIRQENNVMAAWERIFNSLNIG